MKRVLVDRLRLYSSFRYSNFRAVRLLYSGPRVVLSLYRRKKNAWMDLHKDKGELVFPPPRKESAVNLRPTLGNAPEDAVELLLLPGCMRIVSALCFVGKVWHVTGASFQRHVPCSPIETSDRKIHWDSSIGYTGEKTQGTEGTRCGNWPAAGF